MVYSADRRAQRVQALAFQEGWTPSDVTVESYLIDTAPRSSAQN
jgi:hypothetical protein